MDWAAFVLGVGSEAAPLPVSWVGDKVSGDRVAMDVAELLDSFAFGVDVEVVVAGFPYVVFGSGSREALFEHLNGGGELHFLGLCEEKVDVVGHDDVAEDVEVVFESGLFQEG